MFVVAVWAAILWDLWTLQLIHQISVVTVVTAVWLLYSLQLPLKVLCLHAVRGGDTGSDLYHQWVNQDSTHVTLCCFLSES